MTDNEKKRIWQDVLAKVQKEHLLMAVRASEETWKTTAHMFFEEEDEKAVVGCMTAAFLNGAAYVLSQPIIEARKAEDAKIDEWAKARRNKKDK